MGEIQDNGCIIFLGAKDGKGYGRYRTDDGKLGAVSRAVLAAKVGYNLPYNIDACHTCDNPSCINPDHLWPGTRSQNLLDASNKGRTQGKSHPLGNAKLNWDKVQEIRRKLDAGARMKDLAEEYGVGRKTIHDIKYHKTWKVEGAIVPAPVTGGYKERKLTGEQVHACAQPSEERRSHGRYSSRFESVRKCNLRHKKRCDLQRAVTLLRMESSRNGQKR